MSSVLKALRQQQSQLIPQQQPIHLAAITPSKSSLRWWWLMLPVAIVAGWASVYWYLANTKADTNSSVLERTTVSEQGVASNAPQLALGQPQPVRVVDLPRQSDGQNEIAAQVDTTAIARPTTSSFQAAPEIAKDQAVDLNEVPADLLAAFEEAIAATGSGQQSSHPQSVLPRINELDRALQRRIPAFTYDGHQYSSRVQERFVELAGQRLKQGDYWQGIQVLAIAPNHVVLALGNDAFQQPALEDWTTRP